MAPKPILKSTSQTPSKSQANRNLDLALHHARLIQHRKDLEALILTSTETLLDFPGSSTANPAEPSNADESHALKLLHAFCPSDLDSLVEERNIDSKCGYVLCPRRNRKENTSAKYRILRGNKKMGQEIKVVEKEELERWCSDDCGQRALYLRVQLNDTPAWERAGDVNEGPVLRVLKNSQQTETITVDTGANVDTVTQQLKLLAVERGDIDESILTALLKATVIENHPGGHDISRAMVPANRTTDKANSVEGYVSRLPDIQTQRNHAADEQGNIMDTI